MIGAILAAIPAILSTVAGAAGSLLGGAASAVGTVGSAALNIGAGAVSTIGGIGAGAIGAAGQVASGGLTVLGGLPAAVTGTVDYLGRIVEEKGPEIKKGIELYQKWKTEEKVTPPTTTQRQAGTAAQTVYVPELLPAYSAPGAEAPGIYAPAEPGKESNLLLYAMIAVVAIVLLRKR